jgi:peptidyl-prolyl cis-trans isomerase C
MMRIACAILGVVAVLMAGCRREAASPLSGDPPAPTGILSVDGVPILREDLEFELARIRGRGAEADFDAVVAELVQRQQMVAEARRLGLDQEPATRRALEGVLVARWKERQLEPRLADTSSPVPSTASPPPSEPAAGAAPRPEQVSHAAWLRLQFTPRTSSARKSTLRARMDEARAKAFQLDSSVPGFGPLAIDYSDDDATRSMGGDLGWISPSNSSLPGGEAVRAALDGLQQNGEVSPVIEGRDGFYLLRLIERRDSNGRGATARQEAAVASHRAQIERRRAIENAVLAELRERIPVQHHTNALEEVRSAWRAARDRRDDSPAAPPGGGPR